MKILRIFNTILGTVLKVCITVFVILLIYRGTLFGYEYGYRIFAEPPMTTGSGRTEEFVLTEDLVFQLEEDESEFSPRAIREAVNLGKKLGARLEREGLVRDKTLFMFQYLFSEFRVDMKPGVYELSTAMTADEMLEAMTAGNPEEEEE